MLQNSEKINLGIKFPLAAFYGDHTARKYIEQRLKSVDEYSRYSYWSENKDESKIVRLIEESNKITKVLDKKEEPVLIESAYDS